MDTPTSTAPASAKSPHSNGPDIRFRGSSAIGPPLGAVNADIRSTVRPYGVRSQRAERPAMSATGPMLTHHAERLSRPRRAGPSAVQTAGEWRQPRTRGPFTAYLDPTGESSPGRPRPHGTAGRRTGRAARQARPPTRPRGCRRPRPAGRRGPRRVPGVGHRGAPLVGGQLSPPRVMLRRASEPDDEDTVRDRPTTIIVHKF